MSKLEILQAETLHGGPVRHGFFTRHGGVSTGIFASLNCGQGSDDTAEAVNENRARVAAMLEVETDALLSLYQVHSRLAVTVSTPWTADTKPRPDAMVTNVPGIALGILTADCVPVLFADAQAAIIGAAHAGWKGAIGGVLEQAIEAMEALGAKRERIAAAIGPSIAQASYEVGSEFYANFEEADAANTRFFIPSDRPSHWRFDLQAYVEDRLTKAGVSASREAAIDTYAREDLCFSYRRATHRRESDYGRLISAIALMP